MKQQKESPTQDHLKHCHAIITHDCFEIIGREQSKIARRVKESLFIHRDKPTLNIQGTSIPLTLIQELSLEEEAVFLFLFLFKYTIMLLLII